MVYCTGKIHFFLRTITDHHNFLQFGIFGFHDDIDLPSRHADDLFTVTYPCQFESLPYSGFDRELTRYIR
ncbi:hypothetical protein D3C81_1618810 [compost metagenome]